MKRFGVYPYILNQKSDSLDINSTYHSRGAVWQSSTKIGEEDNASRFNFPISLNYMSQTSTQMNATLNATAQEFRTHTGTALVPPENVKVSRGRISEGLVNRQEWVAGARQNSSPMAGILGNTSKEANLTHSLFFDSPKSESMKKRFHPTAAGSSNHGGYPSYQGSSQEPLLLSKQSIGLVGSPRSTLKKLSESRTIINRQASILDENRIVLYKKGKRMGRGYFIVEISSCQTSMFITAFNVEKPQSMILEIPEKRARFILAQFDHDIEQLAGCLTVSNNNKLVLLNPHYATAATSTQEPLLPRRHQRNASNRFHTINLSASDGAIDDGQEEEQNSTLDQKTLSHQGDVYQRVPSNMVQTIDSTGANSLSGMNRNVKTSQEIN